jgi:hypothetical protein
LHRRSFAPVVNFCVGAADEWDGDLEWIPDVENDPDLELYQENPGS